MGGEEGMGEGMGEEMEEGEERKVDRTKGVKELVEAIEVVLTLLVGVIDVEGGEFPVVQPPLLLSALHRGHGSGTSFILSLLFSSLPLLVR